MPPKHRVLLAVTGSIAAYKAADIIRRLKERGRDVSVIMTQEAERFITPLTLESLSGKKVHQHLFHQQTEDDPMPHITLAREADILLIAPATANIIGKLAHGIADDLLTCVALVTRAKILIAPAMNDEMYKHKMVQENIAKLKGIGVQFVDPVVGELACGTIAEGHIAEVEDIIKAVESVK